MRKKIFVTILLLVSHFFYSQSNSNFFSVSTIDSVSTSIPHKDTISTLRKNPLKASLYSAILPGLGQLYNKRYIKAPIVLGVIGTGIGFVKYYDNRYQKYHKAYLAELSGKPHRYSGIMDKRTLANAQDSERRNRDYAIVLTSLAYLLNIVDATVDAHLYIFKEDRDLAIKPIILEEPGAFSYNNQKLGLSLNLSF